MPVYEYTCQACGKTSEALRPMAKADQPMTCSHCGSEDTRRAHSVFSAGAGRAESQPLPMGGCGRCGNPQGSCMMN